MMYGHGDVVDGMEGEWRDNLDRGGRRIRQSGVRPRHRRQQGQHSINMAALRAVRASARRRRLQRQFIIETGEEIGSLDLRQVCDALRRGSEGRSVWPPTGRGYPPDRPTSSRLPRWSAHPPRCEAARRTRIMSGNWGFVLANAATICRAQSLRGRPQGMHAARSIKTAAHFQRNPRCLADVKVEPTAMSRRCRKTGARRGCRRPNGSTPGTTLEVLAMSSGNIASPANAIPGEAHAVLHLRFVVGTRIDRVVGAVRALCATTDVRCRGARCQSFAASRTDFDSPGQLDAESIRQTTRKAPAICRFRGIAPTIVFRRARPADNLGAALLSRLLAARAQRAHSSLGHRRSLGIMPAVLDLVREAARRPGSDGGSARKFTTVALRSIRHQLPDAVAMKWNDEEQKIFRRHYERCRLSSPRHWRFLRGGPDTDTGSPDACRHRLR